MLLLITLAGCGSGKTVDDGSDTADSADSGDSGDSADTSADRCPYDDGGGFYTGGPFTVDVRNVSGTYSWEFPPLAVGGTTCVTLDPDGLAFDWTWLEGSFVEWQEERFDFVEPSSALCTLGGSKFWCAAAEYTTSFDGIDNSPMTLNLGWSANWVGNDAFSGSVALSLGCKDAGCDKVAQEMWQAQYSFPANIRAQVEGRLVE
jgi:hypothetical protein